MKKPYEDIKFEVIKFTFVNVISTSVDTSGGIGDNNNDYDFGNEDF